MSALSDAFGLLTVLRPPRRSRRQATAQDQPWDTARAGAALSYASLVGAALGLTAGAAVWAFSPVGHQLAGVVAVALLAALTRGLHLDGLADTADGLGSGRAAPDALILMRRGDIGPFGVVTLVLVLLLDVAALASLLEGSRWAAAWAAVLAVTTGRYAAQLACRPRLPAAHPDGLGALVATTQTPARLARGGVLVLALAALPLLSGQTDLAGAGVLAAGLGLAAGSALVARCCARLGGVTGDVLGASVEVTQCVALLSLAVLSRVG